MADISPKCQDQVNDHRRPHGEQGGVHKILPDLTWGDPKPVADCGTNPERIPFDQAFQAIHVSKVGNSARLPVDPAPEFARR